MDVSDGQLPSEKTNKQKVCACRSCVVSECNIDNSD